MPTRTTPIELLYRDERILAADKPAGIPSVPARGQPPSLIKRLALQLDLPWKGETDPRLRALHRIDQDTSGVVLLALDIDAQRMISHQFQNNTVQKEYLALVAGATLDESGTIEAPLDRDPRNPMRMCVPRQGKLQRKGKIRGKRALTEWKVEERFKLFTLLRVFPRTGKTHQIRVHLAHIGHPLAVDPIYGHAARQAETPLTSADGKAGGKSASKASDKAGDELRFEASTVPSGLMLSVFKRGYRSKREEDERPLISRLTLHAAKLSLLHPSEQMISVESPLPKDFRATLNQLRKFGR